MDVALAAIFVRFWERNIWRDRDEFYDPALLARVFLFLRFRLL